MSNDSASITVTDLVRNFAAACRAITPYLDMAKVPWGDGEQYDGWDRIAEGVFMSLVLEPARCAVAARGLTNINPVAYGFAKPTAGQNAYVEVALGNGSSGMLIEVLAGGGSFDRVHFRVADGSSIVDLNSCDFSFVVETSDKVLRLTEVDLLI